MNHGVASRPTQPIPRVSYLSAQGLWSSAFLDIVYCSSDRVTACQSWITHPLVPTNRSELCVIVFCRERLCDESQASQLVTVCLSQSVYNLLITRHHSSPNFTDGTLHRCKASVTLRVVVVDYVFGTCCLSLIY
ncbi:hypothetical protein J6590_071120 [Homalodisca vitripennis]|nr:hypothetical protein J6590_071120 [Homalodisca vitripennis]